MQLRSEAYKQALERRLGERVGRLSAAAGSIIHTVSVSGTDERPVVANNDCFKLLRLHHAPLLAAGPEFGKRIEAWDGIKIVLDQTTKTCRLSV